MSLSNIILKYLRDKYPLVIHKGTLGKMAVNEWGFLNENLGRRCRELENSGAIKRIPDEKGRVMYQYIPLEGFEKLKQKEFIKPANMLFKIENNGSNISEKDLLKYR